MPFGENNRHVPVRLIDFEELKKNSFIATTQFHIHHRETKIPVVVLNFDYSRITINVE